MAGSKLGHVNSGATEARMRAMLPYSARLSPCSAMRAHRGLQVGLASSVLPGMALHRAECRLLDAWSSQ